MQIIVEFADDISLREANEVLEPFCDNNRHLLKDVHFRG